MLTYGRIAAMKAAAGEPWPDAIATYTYNGDPLLDVELPLVNGAMSKRHYELMMLACALGNYERDAKIEDRKDGVAGKQESPDFFVEFTDRRIVGVEVARLTDEGRTERDALAAKINRALGDEFAANAALAQRFAKLSLSIRLTIHETTGFKPRDLVAAVVEKLLRLPAAIIRPSAIVTPAPSDELLVKYGFFMMFNERHHEWIEVTPHLPNDSIDEQQALLDLIQKKAGLTYHTQGHPLWLALAITDPFGQLTFDLKSFAERAYAIFQFDRMIITNGSQSVITKPLAREPV